MKHKTLFALILILSLLVLLSLIWIILETNSNIPNNINNNDVTNYAGNVPPKPIVDNAKIEVTILKLNKTDSGALIRINKIVDYTHDPRAQYNPLFENQELEIEFQWGTEPRIIDLPPVDDSEGDITLSGVKEGDVILADMDNKYGWRIYNYEVLK